MQAETGLSLFEFGDETEKFVVIQMMEKGSLLYKDIFVNHGMFPYVLIQAYSRIVSSTDFTNVRIISTLLAILAAISVFSSPIFSKLAERVWATSLFVALLSSFWLVQSLNFLYYHSMGGLLFITPLMHMALPALIHNRVSPLGAMVSGAFVVILCFTSYSFGLAAVFLFVSSLVALIKSEYPRKKTLLYFVIGVISLTVLLCLWLLKYGDLIGYYAYHFYFNMNMWSEWTSFSLLKVFRNFMISTDPSKTVQSFSIILWTGSLILFVLSFIRRKSKSTIYKAASLVLLLFSVLLLNLRGGYTFHNASFVIGSIALFSAMLVFFYRNFFSTKMYYVLTVASFLLVFVFAEWVSTISKSAIHGVYKADYENYQIAFKPSSEEPFVFIRDITGEDEKVLSMVFQLAVYLKADRLPASGQIFYLPIQADYMKKPVKGYVIDICEDMRKNEPKVIWFDNWKVGDQVYMKDYEPCVTQIMDQNYTQVSDRLFILSEVAAQIGLKDSPLFTENPIQLTAEPSSYQLLFADQYKAAEDDIMRIGILIDQESEESAGGLELRLVDESGLEFTSHIILDSQIEGKKYQFVELEPNHYISAELIKKFEEDLTVWESDSPLKKYTCLIYVFENGEKIFTPGCSLNY
jgi:hypothetical protein